MARHSKPSVNLNDKDNGLQIMKSKIEDTIDSNQLNINHTLPNLTLYDGNDLKSKLSESEGKISKLISEIDLLKKKVY